MNDLSNILSTAEVDALIIKAIGKELRLARQDKDWTRGDLTARMASNIPINTYACYERGTRLCSIPRLVEICHALDISTRKLLERIIQRVETELQTEGLPVDIGRLASAGEVMPDLLRQWARNRLELEVGTSIVKLDGELLKEMAVLLGMDMAELIELLKKFPPETTPAINSSRS